VFIAIFVLFLIAITVLTVFAVRFVIRRDRQLRADYRAQREAANKDA
jgi:hypothetical protein